MPTAVTALRTDPGAERRRDVATRLAYEGLLQVEQPERAANHFIWLALGELTSRSRLGVTPLTEAEVVETVAAGVRAFLHGYLPRPTA